VPQPPELVFFGRIAKPSEVLKVVGGWTRLPMPGSEVVAEMLTGDRTGKLIDLDQPVDLVVATDSTKHAFSQNWAVAAAVLSLEDAKTALSVHYKLVPGDNGAIVISGLGGADSDGDDDGHPHACSLAPAVGPGPGPGPARLVCGSSDGALRALLPFLTRTSPRRTIASDVHLEMHSEPVRGFIGLGRTMMPGMLSSALGVHRQSDPAAADVIDGLTAEVADFGTDLDGLTIDAKLEDTSARLETKASFKTATSLTTRMLTAHADRVDLPPATFWHLPADSDLAFFNRGMDTKDLERPRDMLLKVLGHALEKEGLADSDRTAISDALSHLFTSSAPAVFAKGVDFAATQLALDSIDAAKDDAAKDTAMRAAVADAVGWWLLGIDESPARVQGALKEMASVWNRPAVAKLMKADAKGSKPPILKMVATSGALKLPKDTTHLELTVFPEASSGPGGPGTAPKKGAKPAPPEKPFNLHVFAVPDAGHVWVAIGANEALMASKVRASMAGAPPTDTLASRAGLEPLKDARVSSGGFVTLRSVFTGMPDAVPGAQGHRAKRVYAALQGFADQGSTPIFTTVTSAAPAADAAAGSVSSSIQLPKPAIEGIVRFIMAGGHF
jgi:hypothetical protein